MNLQKYNRMKKPANRLYMALALGAGICLTASCASDDGFAADEGALELQRIEVEGEESITLSFEEIEFYTGVALKHSFLKEKKQAEMYGYRVDKIFLREKRIISFIFTPETSILPESTS